MTIYCPYPQGLRTRIQKEAIMSNCQPHHLDLYKNLRMFPPNIQMPICLVASALRRMATKQEQLDA